MILKTTSNISAVTTSMKSISVSGRQLAMLANVVSRKIASDVGIITSWSLNVCFVVKSAPNKQVNQFVSYSEAQRPTRHNVTHSSQQITWMVQALQPITWLQEIVATRHAFSAKILHKLQYRHSIAQPEHCTWQCAMLSALVELLVNSDRIHYWHSTCKTQDVFRLNDWRIIYENIKEWISCSCRRRKKSGNTHQWGGHDTDWR